MSIKNLSENIKTAYRLRYSDSGEEELPLSDVVHLLSTLDSRRDDNHVGALTEVAVSPGHHHVGEHSVIASDATTIIALPLPGMDIGPTIFGTAMRRPRAASHGIRQGTIFSVLNLVYSLHMN